MPDDPPLTRRQPSRPADGGYGGQAVTGGVMIRSPRYAVVVCHRPSGGLAWRTRSLHASYAMRFRRFPLLRGALTLLETLQVGFWALTFAQRVALGRNEDEESSGVDAAGIITMAIALSFMIGGFFVAPVFATRWIENTSAPAILSPIAEGVLRLLMLLAYMWLIGRLPEVRRTFQYHGAEHKTIAAWEAGDELTEDRVARYSRAHPRCGTSFLLVVVLIALIVFTALGNPPLWWRVTSRIVLVPPIVAVAYEIIRLGGIHRANRFVAALFAPNLWLQSLTTREPNRDQITVAIAAMKAALTLEDEEPQKA